MITNKDFFSAVLANDIAFVKKAIDSGFKINEMREGTKRTALHIAITNYHVELVEFLILHEADCNMCDESGCTPLGVAIIWLNLNKKQENHAKCLKIIELLLEAGANPTFKDKKDANNPLYLLAEPHVKEDIRQVFIRLGKDPINDKTSLENPIQNMPSTKRYSASINEFTRKKTLWDNVVGWFSSSKPINKEENIPLLQKEIKIKKE